MIFPRTIQGDDEKDGDATYIIQESRGQESDGAGVRSLESRMSPSATVPLWWLPSRQRS